MGVAKPSVLLIGASHWRSAVRERCPKTDFEDADSVQTSIAAAVALVLIENQTYLKDLLANRELDHVRILLCDGPSFIALDERIQSVSVESLSDSLLATYLRVGCTGSDLDSDFESQVRSEGIKEFRTTLLDAACQLLANWHVPNPANEPKQFDGFAFNEHIGQLKSTLSHQAGAFLVAETLPHAISSLTNIRVCLYQCEKTVFLATKRVTPDSTFRSAAQGNEFVFTDDVTVVCNDIYLTAILIVILSMAPPEACFPLCACAVNDNTVEIEFPYAIKDPDGLEAGFAAQLMQGIQTVLQDFGASMDFIPTVKLRLARERV